MNKKIGILTYHNANNYGAALQAFALQSFLKDMFGDDQVDIIDYKCEGVKKQRSCWKLIKEQGLVRGVIHYSIAAIRIKKIEDFCKKHMSLSRPVADREQLKQLALEYDYLVSGSDQVWNRKWTGGEDTYLQDFHEQNDKKISYAASFGVSELPEEWKEDYRHLLCCFSHISVREEEGRKIVENELQLSAKVHLDPTLLLRKDKWNDLISQHHPSKPYVLVYMVPYQQSVYNKAKQIADEHHLKLYVVCKSMKHFGREYKGCVSVEELLALISHAEYMVTNSFHGTAFSIIFQKKAVIDLNNKWGYNIRSAQLLKTCELAGDQNSDKGVIQCFDVDWSRVYSLLANEQSRTVEYFAALKG